ncbi:MAG: hypothetical protein ACYC4U_14475 [Pirellulaceae bacterium]
MTVSFSRSRIEDVVARLQKSKIGSETTDFDSGCAVGMEWAAATAEYAELIALAQIQEQRISDPSCDPIVQGDEESYDNAYTVTERVFFLISPANDGDREAAWDFWTVVQGDGDFAPSTAWLNGFIDGALIVFDAVRDKL